ncbi:MAG: flagellar type III secretion system pore protein FliP [Deltaproteobacteria bacterium]|nr:flagellar type III secretion system pore protein FliP [Deltaproteobacteria bacterium]MCX7953421.1 flagellar type III secretion system pore protein FliP [Deltaproteobacteria bacterium]
MKKLFLLLLVAGLNSETQLVSINVGGAQLSGVMKLMFVMTLLSFGPAIVMTMTSFTRLIIIFSLLRTALGLQGAPPNLVLTGLALFLTFSLMSPVLEKSYTEGIKPFLEGSASDSESLKKAVLPFKQFMLQNTREKDLDLFVNLSKTNPGSKEELPLSVVLPAFVISEMTMAFSIGFLIAIPFLIVDLVIASVLASMSMITLPPIVISLPIKLMLFVMVDGWNLVISNILESYSL